VHPELRLRRAVRAVILDPADRVLLVRFEFPESGVHWALPGGGLEADETHEVALRRELTEEVGLRDASIGAHIWTRLHILSLFGGRFDGQHEHIHLVRTPEFDPAPALTWEQLNAECVYEIRWWTLEEITTSDERFVPSALGHHLRSILIDGAPIAPVDIEA
jgi:ADP-ribose pyrophosphatase YjhB (NUDIX family)